MAVYTQLDATALQALWSVYDDDKALLRADGIPHGSINTTYRLETEAGAFFLRINEEKRFDDVIYERDLLRALAGRVPATIPTIRQTRIGGSFYLVEKRAGRPIWACLFPALPGRDLGVFEVTPEHCRQVGSFMGHAHVALRGFRRRPNPYREAVVHAWLRALPHEVTPRLQASLARHRRRPLPKGTVHGDLFIDNTKWTRASAGAQGGPVLAAVFDWEMAGRDALLLDVAIALHAWCWRREQGAYDAGCARALVDGYRGARELRPSERRGFFAEAVFAAVRFTASRVRDFEVPRAHRDGQNGKSERAYLDYRDFLARLDALESMRERALLRMTGLAA